MAEEKIVEAVAVLSSHLLHLANDPASALMSTIEGLRAKVASELSEHPEYEPHVGYRVQVILSQPVTVSPESPESPPS